MKSKKVILIYPSYDPDNPYPDFNTDKMKKQPLGVLALGSYIKSVGYDVKFYEGREHYKEDLRKAIIEEAKNALCVGFSVMTSQIKHAYLLSKELKELYPDLNIVWGSIHPTLYPEQTIEPDYIDYVIIGEAEHRFEQLLKYFGDEKVNINSIENLVWKNKNGAIVKNPVGPPVDVNKLPDPDYSLLNMDTFLKGPFWNYLDYKIERLFDLLTSRGCPYNCRFCATTLPAFKKWRPISAERVNNLIDIAVNKYKATHIQMNDDFFFGDKDRVYAIIEHIKKRKYKITWEALATVPLFKSYFTDDLLRQYKESGGIVIGMGVESGSDRILKHINKPQTVEEVMHAIRRCKEFDIIPKVSFITGIPGETHEEAVMTVKLIARIFEENPRTSFFVPGLFRPYPGADLYKECIKMGFKEPKTLEDWCNYELHDNYFVKPEDLPWVEHPEFHINVPFVAFNYVYYKFNKDRIKLPISRKIAGKISELRMEKDWWKFPYEYKFTLWKKGLEKNPFLKKMIQKFT
ncbi:B12-binding domain-containing radical SAM protein [candidate division KSB1 bacterium]